MWVMQARRGIRMLSIDRMFTASSGSCVLNLLLYLERMGLVFFVLHTETGDRDQVKSSELIQIQVNYDLKWKGVKGFPLNFCRSIHSTPKIS